MRPRCTKGKGFYPISHANFAGLARTEGIAIQIIFAAIQSFRPAPRIVWGAVLSFVIGADADASGASSRLLHAKYQ
jgi:hypothetical protein